MRKQQQSICWDCRHSGRRPDDDYYCPWAREGKPIRKWMRDRDGYVYRCPHFVEDGIWRPAEIYKGAWANGKPVKYVQQSFRGRRIVCLNTGIMYPSMLAAGRAMAQEGRGKHKLETRVGFMQQARVYPTGKFKQYGLTWVLLENEPRQGNWKHRWMEEHYAKYYPGSDKVGDYGDEE